MTQCPKCGSNEIIPDLVVFSHGGKIGPQPVFVTLLQPEPANRGFVWQPDSTTTGFRADVCGECGHAELFTKFPQELLAAHKKGYKSKEK